MNGTNTTELFGFIPLAQLHALNAASPNESLKFLLDRQDIKANRKEPNFELQLNQRIFLLAQAAILKNDSKYIDFALKKIAKKYTCFSLAIHDIQEAQKILKSYQSNWLNQLQKILVLWRKSCAFADELKSKFDDDSYKVLDEFDLLLSHTIFLRAAQAYKVCAKAQEVLSKWQTIIKYEYGLLPLNKVSHLGSISNENKNYQILLDCKILLQQLEDNPTTDPVLLHHISRRVIGLAGAALITCQEVYFSQAHDLIEKVQQQSTNTEIARAKEFLLSAKEIGLHKDWKEKWLNLKHILEESSEMSMLIAKDSDLSLLRSNDLDTTIRKYLFVRANEEILSKVDIKMREKRNVSFQKTSLRNALLEEAKLAMGRRKYKPIKKAAEEADEKVSPRDEKNNSPRNEQLEKWLKTYHPIIFDLYICKYSRVSLTNFLQRYYPEILNNYNEGKSEASIPFEMFDRYRKMADDPRMSFTCLSYFFATQRTIVLEFFSRCPFINFSSFIFHCHNSEFQNFLIEFDKGNTDLSFEKIEDFKITELSSRTQRRKKHLFLLHNDHEFQSFLKNALFNVIEDSKEIEELIFKLSLSLQKKCNKSLELFDTIYSIYTLTFFKRVHRKPEIVYSCYEYFLRYNPLAIKKFIKSAHYYSFLKFCLENYSDDLKIFLLNLYISNIETVCQQSCIKRQIPAVTLISFEEHHVPIAKKYIHSLMTNEEFRKKVEQTLSTNERELEITELQAKTLNNARHVKINGNFYEVLSLENTTINKPCWKIRLKYHKKFIEMGYQFELIEIPSVAECFKKSNNGKLTIPELLGDLMASKIEEANLAYVKIGTNIFKLTSLKHDVLPFNAFLLKVKPAAHQQEEVYEIDAKNSNALDLIAALQDNVFKNRKTAVELLDRVNLIAVSDTRL